MTKLKFLCDHMLVRLGKWLRIAGYDTQIIMDNRPDREVLKNALTEQRLLLTRDQHFLEMKAALPLLIFFQANSFEECVRELKQKVAVNWLYAPFSRCLVCNSLLQPVDLELVWEQLPSNREDPLSPVWMCPFCHHLYWQGSHTEQMYAQLWRWQQEKT